MDGMAMGEDFGFLFWIWGIFVLVAIIFFFEQYLTVSKKIAEIEKGEN